MTRDRNSFEGTWHLLPELSQYQDGHPPLEGSCSIVCTDGTVTCHMDWTDEHGKAHNLTQSGPLDGSVVAIKGGKLETSFTRIDAQRLDNSTYYQGRETAYTHRKTSTDGALMVQLMVHHHKEERSTRNFQVYRRAG